MKLFLDHLGGPQTTTTIIAHGLNTVCYASHEGGIADPAIISWPNGIAAHGEIRDNWSMSANAHRLHDLLGMTPPGTVKGFRSPDGLRSFS